MCGICGIALNPARARAVDRVSLARMNDVLVHRGPDSGGQFVDGHVGLAMRRLSIIDVADGAQPMTSDDGSTHIVYNGEVYNHEILRRELQGRGHSYRTRCDTETVLRLYEEDGERTPRRLRGMFAFAIWDARRRVLFLARDRLGVKPLYYVHAEDGSLYFASEIKSLLAGGALRASLNLGVLPDYLANYAPGGDETLFAGVRRLPAGHTLVWHDGTLRMERYWDVSFAPARGDVRADSDVVHEYRERLTESVRMRLMADVPLGVFLSGGIDSAAITAITARLVDAPVRTFSVGFAEREANELHYARSVARRYRTQHHEVVVSPEDFFAAWPKLVWHEDEPIAHPSSIPLYFVARLASEHVKVVLTGEGSDETLAGYGRYRATIFNAAASRGLALVPGGAALRRSLGAAVGLLPRRSPLRRALLRSALCRSTDLRSLYFDNFAVFSRSEQTGVLSPALREVLDGVDPYAAAHRHLEQTDATSLLNRLLYVDIKTFLQELLMKQDQMSMAASVESRVPFLDHPLVEFTASLPDRFKLRGTVTKYVLRQAMRDLLPEEILGRRKMGFPVPIAEWFRGPYRHLVEDYALSERVAARGLFDGGVVRRIADEHFHGIANHAQQLWSLMNVEMWHRVFMDGDNAIPTGPPRASTGRSAAPAVI